MWTLAFWKDTVERALRTTAQTLLTFWLLGDQVFNVLAVDWRAAAGVAGGAALLSLLTSIAAGALPVGQRGTPATIFYPNRQPVGRHERVGRQVAE